MSMDLDFDLYMLYVFCILNFFCFCWFEKVFKSGLLGCIYVVKICGFKFSFVSLTIIKMCEEMSGNFS